MYVGTGHVWRTKTWGMGTMTLAEFRQHCNEWFGDFAVICGDWLPLGNPSTAGRLGATAYGADRAGGFVAAVERATQDASTLWAATQTGRVFISRNANAEPASGVTFTRLDSLAANDPEPLRERHLHRSGQRQPRVDLVLKVSAPRRPTTPGHVFSVTYDPVAGTATWTDVSYDLGDIPINDIASDSVSGDLYAASDFGVFRLVAGTTRLGRRGPRHAERGSGRPEHAGRRAQALCRHPRPWCVGLEPAVASAGERARSA